MTIDEYAELASHACSRWYGRVASFESYIRREQIPSCAEFFKSHWRQFPATSPDGRGKIIEHDEVATVPLIGFGEEPSKKSE